MTGYDRIFKESHYDGGASGWGNMVVTYDCYDAVTGEYVGEDVEVIECDEKGIPISEK